VDWVEVDVGEGDDKTTMRVDDKEQIELILMKNNEKCFRLTESSPPMTEPLLSELGYLVDTEAAQRILDGTYVCPPGVNVLTCVHRGSM